MELKELSDIRLIFESLLKQNLRRTMTEAGLDKEATAAAFKDGRREL